MNATEQMRALSRDERDRLILESGEKVIDLRERLAPQKMKPLEDGDRVA